MARHLLALLMLWTAAPSFAASPLVVMIDPGHGGRDHGTVHDGAQESDITLRVSQHVQELLAHDHRFRTLMTRNVDTSLSLLQRAQSAKTQQASVFVSIHVNSSPDARAKGAEFYFQNQMPSDEESMFLAHKENLTENGEKLEPLTYDFLDQVQYPQEVRQILSDLLDSDRVWRSAQLAKALKSHWRGPHKSQTNSVRQAPFYVLNQMRVPSTLVELGFITNGDDRRALTNEGNQRQMAKDIYLGLVAYKEQIDKLKQTP